MLTSRLNVDGHKCNLVAAGDTDIRISEMISSLGGRLSNAEGRPPGDGALSEPDRDRSVDMRWLMRWQRSKRLRYSSKALGRPAVSQRSGI